MQRQLFSCTSHVKKINFLRQFNSIQSRKIQASVSSDQLQFTLKFKAWNFKLQVSTVKSACFQWRVDLVSIIIQWPFLLFVSIHLVGFNDRNKPTHTARGKVQLHIWSASLISRCCCFFPSFALDALFVFFFRALYIMHRNYVLKKATKTKTKLHLKHLIKFLFRLFHRCKISLFFLRKTSANVGQHMHILIILYMKSYNDVVSNVHATLLTPSSQPRDDLSLPSRRDSSRFVWIWDLNPPFESWWLLKCVISRSRIVMQFWVIN